MRLRRENVHRIHFPIHRSFVLDLFYIYLFFSSALPSGSPSRRRTRDIFLENVIFVDDAIDKPLAFSVQDYNFPL